MKDDKTTDAGERIKVLLRELGEYAARAHICLEQIDARADEVSGLLGDIQRGRPLTRRERILASLAGETRSQSYLADDTGIGYGTLGAELVLMAADGMVEKVGRGTWKAVSA